MLTDWDKSLLFSSLEEDPLYIAYADMMAKVARMLMLM